MLLEVKNLTFRYEELLVLKDLCLTVNSGEILLVSGPNGAGKTTLLNCITGLINQGRNIYYDGQEASQDKNLLRNNSFIMSSDTLYEYLTSEENVSFYKNLFRGGNEFLDRFHEYSRLFGLEEYMDVLVKNLSQGTRNKLYIAIMLSKEHRVLVLDEPFTALDAATQKIMLESLQKDASGRCTLIVTHIGEFKKLATGEVTLKKITHEHGAKLTKIPETSNRPIKTISPAQ